MEFITENGELHQYQASRYICFKVQCSDLIKFIKYTEGIYNLPPINLRDLIDFRKRYLNKPIELTEVEPIENILKRFGSGSMSHGALSKEAHETLAIGMNRIRGASCSGEGGEDEKDLLKWKMGIVQLESKTNSIC